MPFPLPQDEELARQLQLELNALSGVQEKGEGVTVPLHGDLQSTLTVSHHVRTVYCPYIVRVSLFSVYHFHRMRIMLVSCSLSLILVWKVVRLVYFRL